MGMLPLPNNRTSLANAVAVDGDIIYLIGSFGNRHSMLLSSLHCIVSCCLKKDISQGLTHRLSSRAQRHRIWMLAHLIDWSCGQTPTLGFRSAISTTPTLPFCLISWLQRPRCSTTMLSTLGLSSLSTRSSMDPQS